MRLIDADKIDYIMGEKPSRLDYVRRAHIDDEPTVEAIPIKWIKKHISKLSAEIDTSIEDGATNWDLIEDVRGMDRLLEDWENERETN